MDITVGTVLEATSARGERVRLRALSQPMAGRDFRVVWACAADVWEPDLDVTAGLPWALEDVVVAEPADV